MSKATPRNNKLNFTSKDQKDRWVEKCHLFLLKKYKYTYMCQGLNSHYLHIVGDKLINPIVGV